MEWFNCRWVTRTDEQNNFEVKGPTDNYGEKIAIDEGQQSYESRKSHKTLSFLSVVATPKFCTTSTFFYVSLFE